MRTSYPEIPNAVCGAMDELVALIRQLLASKLPLQSIEQDLAGSLAAVGCAVVGAALAAHDPGGEDVQIDGRRYWQAVRAEREYMSSFGRVKVERGLYRSVRNGPTVCPLELRAQIIEHFWTARAAKLAALSVSDMTPNRAEKLFAETGLMAPSRSSLDRLPKILNALWESDRENFEARVRESERAPDQAVTVAISLDGVMVSTRTGAKAAKKAKARADGRAAKGPAGQTEAGCGSITFYDALGERLLTRRFARMPEPDKRTLKQQLDAELGHIRKQRPDLVVVAIADGAHNNWSYLDTIGANYQLVDFYHVAEHVKRALDTCVGASSVSTQRRFGRLRKTLRYDRRGAAKVRARLARLRRQKLAGNHRDYRTSLRYFKRHAARMNYAALASKNMPIGSGVIEGTCKSIVSDRLKRAGMRWDTHGGQAILNLRAWNQSDRFNTAWDLLMERYHAPNCSFPRAA